MLRLPGLASRSVRVQANTSKFIMYCVGDYQLISLQQSVSRLAVTCAIFVTNCQKVNTEELDIYETDYELLTCLATWF